LRQRKDNFGGKGYAGTIMNDILTISETSVADLLAVTPKAVRFFIDHVTACAICSLARFCTLKDVIITYGLDETAFLKDLAKIDLHKL
jgi:hypothetical protein